MPRGSWLPPWRCTRTWGPLVSEPTCNTTHALLEASLMSHVTCVTHVTQITCITYTTCVTCITYKTYSAHVACTTHTVHSKHHYYIFNRPSRAGVRVRVRVKG
ncbi:unnamed protein product [Discosporangium mesarthrocarpum]